MNPMKKEMESECPSGVGEVLVQVEEETVHCVLKDGPDDVTG